MKTWIKSVRDRLFGTRHTLPIRKRSQSRRMRVETLEDRAVPATLWYVNAGFSGSESGTQSNPYNTIQEGINAATAGDTVLVQDGTYVENVVIDRNIKLISENGRVATIIQGTSNGALGTILITTNSNGVEIGASGQGFTINGIDNPVVRPENETTRGRCDW